MQRPCLARLACATSTTSRCGDRTTTSPALTPTTPTPRDRACPRRHQRQRQSFLAALRRGPRCPRCLRVKPDRRTARSGPRSARGGVFQHRGSEGTEGHRGRREERGFASIHVSTIDPKRGHGRADGHASCRRCAAVHQVPRRPSSAQNEGSRGATHQMENMRSRSAFGTPDGWSARILPRSVGDGGNAHDANGRR